MLTPIYTWNVYGRTATSAGLVLLASVESARGAFDLLDWLRMDVWNINIRDAYIRQEARSC